MCDRITIKIEVKSYIKKYLVKVYGEEPIMFPKKSHYNRLIVMNIQKTPEDYKHESFNNKCSVEIILPYNNLRDIRSYNYLSRDNVMALRKEFREEFEHDYKKCIDKAMRDEKLNRKDATILCMKNYNISDSDITFDAFYKSVWRRMLQRIACITVSIF